MTAIGFFDSCHLLRVQGVVRCEVKSLFLVVATFHTKKILQKCQHRYPFQISLLKPFVIDHSIRIIFRHRVEPLTSVCWNPMVFLVLKIGLIASNLRIEYSYKEAENIFCMECEVMNNIARELFLRITE